MRLAAQKSHQKTDQKLSQKGVTLLEVLVVITILSILASFAIPSFQEFLVRRDLDSSRASLSQSLQLARQIARSENTIVDINLSNNTMQISPRNGSPSKTVTFSSRINFVTMDNGNTLSFIFRPVGTIARPEGDQVIDILTDLKIKIQPSQLLDETLEEIVTVGSYGGVASN
ncbi:MAG: prepilin-type N-terminal cleavage/methylation domain-containing protein [Gammaproteobacteria bacterium]|nr:prepilin-type N-terminal cleavage/methylation domain-containing protein [Gammaproteobacteria bacterium]